MGNLANFAVFGALFAAARLLGGMTDPQPQISVLVYDFAGVPRAMLRTAEEQSDIILKSAGVKLLWTQCSVIPRQPGPDQTCPYDPGPADLVIHILRQGSTSRRTDANALGFALPAERNRFAYFAGVFYDRVAAVDHGMTASALLGGVIAHEIG